MTPPPDLPARIGPVEFGMVGGMVAVRCPAELARIMGSLDDLLKIAR